MTEMKVYEFAKKWLYAEIKKQKARVEKAKISGVNLDTQEAILELRCNQLEYVESHLDNDYNLIEKGDN